MMCGCNGCGSGEMAIAEGVTLLPQRATTRGGRRVRVDMNGLAENVRLAEGNRRLFGRRALFALNFISNPGAGKTAMWEASARVLCREYPVAVIEGDKQADTDARRIRASGAKVFQINSGEGCRLDAQLIQRGVERLNPDTGSFLFVENVGNLACPVEFELGEAHKVVALSVTEGDDTPFKYPVAFRSASVMVITQADRFPHVNFHVRRCVAAARRVNPCIGYFVVSARTGEGMGQWLAWLLAARSRFLQGASAAV